MKEEITKAWNRFKDSGKIEDYLEYRKLIQKESNKYKNNPTK